MSSRSRASNELEKKITNGTDFATLARTDSDNQQSAAQGGVLGKFAVGSPQVPPDVKKAIMPLQAGKVAEPVRIPSAFLILRVDRRNKLTYDQAKISIEQKLQSDRNQTILKQELEKY
jgi:parvulin-like peptidyl-prolyl isomerase